MEAEALNTTAVIVGVVAGFLFGWIIYHPKVLGTIWAKGSGVDLESGDEPPVLAFGLQIGALVCLALVIGMTATISYLGTAMLAIGGCILFVVGGGAFSGKSMGAMLTDGFYVLGAGALMIVAQGAL